MKTMKLDEYIGRAMSELLYYHGEIDNYTSHRWLAMGSLTEKLARRLVRHEKLEALLGSEHHMPAQETEYENLSQSVIRNAYRLIQNLGVKKPETINLVYPDGKPDIERISSVLAIAAYAYIISNVKYQAKL